MADLDEILSFAKDSDVATIVTDGMVRATYANSAFTKLSGYPEEDVLGKKPGDLLRGENSCAHSRERFHEGLNALIPFEVKVKNYRKDTHEEYIAGIYVLPVRDSSKRESTFYVALQRELDSPDDDILSDRRFSKALSSVVDLVTGIDD